MRDSTMQNQLWLVQMQVFATAALMTSQAHYEELQLLRSQREDSSLMAEQSLDRTACAAVAFPYSSEVGRHKDTHYRR